MECVLNIHFINLSLDKDVLVFTLSAFDKLSNKKLLAWTWSCFPCHCFLLPAEFGSLLSQKSIQLFLFWLYLHFCIVIEIVLLT